MKKLSIAVLLLVGLLVALPAFAMDTGSSSSSQTERSTSPSSSSQMGGSSMTQSKSASDMHAFRANDLIGKTVKNQNGEELGKVEDLVVGQDGSVRFAILSHGGLLGAGAKYVPVPFQTLMSNSSNIAKISTDNDLIANLDKSKLDSGPSFSDKNWDISNKDWQDKVCSFYGAGSCRFL